MKNIFTYELDSSLRELLISSPPGFRNTCEIQYILRQLERMHFSQDIITYYGKETLMNVINTMSVKRFQKGKFILSNKDVSSNIYIMLEGSAHVIICNTNDASYPKVINQITQGNFFSERDLPKGKNIQSSCIQTSTNSLIAQLCKKEFLSIYESIINRKHNEDIKVFRSNELFTNKQKFYIEKCINEMEIKTFEPNQAIISQNDQCDCIYIIKKGSFELLNQTSTKRESELDISFYSKEQDKCKERERFTNNRLYELKKGKRINEVRKIFVYGVGEIIGDIEMIGNINKSIFSAIATEAGCEVFYCSRDKFKKVLGKNYNTFVDITKGKFNKIKQRVIKLKEFNKKHLSLPEKRFQFLYKNKLDKIISNKEKEKNQINNNLIQKNKIMPILQNKNFCRLKLKPNIHNKFYNYSISKQPVSTSNTTSSSKRPVYNIKNSFSLRRGPVYKLFVNRKQRNTKILTDNNDLSTSCFSQKSSEMSKTASINRKRTIATDLTSNNKNRELNFIPLIILKQSQSKMSTPSHKNNLVLSNCTYSMRSSKEKTEHSGARRIFLMQSNPINDNLLRKNLFIDKEQFSSILKEKLSLICKKARMSFFLKK